MALGVVRAKLGLSYSQLEGNKAGMATKCTADRTGRDMWQHTKDDLLHQGFIYVLHGS